MDNVKRKIGAFYTERVCDECWLFDIEDESCRHTDTFGKIVERKNNEYEIPDWCKLPNLIDHLPSTKEKM